MLCRGRRVRSRAPGAAHAVGAAAEVAEIALGAADSLDATAARTPVEAAATDERNAPPAVLPRRRHSDRCRDEAENGQGGGDDEARQGDSHAQVVARNRRGTRGYRESPTRQRRAGLSRCRSWLFAYGVHIGPPPPWPTPGMLPQPPSGPPPPQAVTPLMGTQPLPPAALPPPQPTPSTQPPPPGEGGGGGSWANTTGALGAGATGWAVAAGARANADAAAPAMIIGDMSFSAFMPTVYHRLLRLKHRSREELHIF